MTLPENWRQPAAALYSVTHIAVKHMLNRLQSVAARACVMRFISPVYTGQNAGKCSSGSKLHALAVESASSGCSQPLHSERCNLKVEPSSSIEDKVAQKAHGHKHAVPLAITLILELQMTPGCRQRSQQLFICIASQSTHQVQECCNSHSSAKHTPETVDSQQCPLQIFTTQRHTAVCILLPLYMHARCN